jgi:putative glycosyltransferase (TIGR04372 family)
VLVSRPDGSSEARLVVDTLQTLALASASGSAVCFLPPRERSNDLLLAFRSDVPLTSDEGVRGLWFHARMNARESAQWIRARLTEGRASFWKELSREVRRQAGDDRLPFPLRSWLRDAARTYLSYATSGSRCTNRYPRELLSEPVLITLPDSVRAKAREEAEACGVEEGPPVVVFEARGPFSVAACRFMADEGYTVVRIGAPASGVIADRRVIDLTSRERSRRLELYLFSIARFVVCESAVFQQLALLTNTPSLRLDAEDPFSAYPVREHGLFTLKQAIDLDTGRFLSMRDRLTEGYYRNLRNCGYRTSTEADVLAAVREMHEGISRGWRDTTAQAAFRDLVTRAGEELSFRVPHVAEWGPHHGFIGRGRLARVQAERMS